MKVSEFRNLIREEIRKVINEDESGWDNTTVDRALKLLKAKLSPEGYAIVQKFANSAATKSMKGNRYSMITNLAYVFGLKVDSIMDDKIEKTRSLNLGDLKSYENKSLYKLIDTGDLVPSDMYKGRYVAK